MAKRFNETHFAVWMREVDAALVIICGLVTADLPDCTYRDWYDDGVSPKAAAKRARRQAEFA